MERKTCVGRKSYVVYLIIDEHVTNHGIHNNCKTAFQRAYATVKGIPSAEATVRVEGNLIAYFKTDWRGVVCEVEAYRPRTRRSDRQLFVKELNPQWSGWSQAQ